MLTDTCSRILMLSEVFWLVALHSPYQSPQWSNIQIEISFVLWILIPFWSLKHWEVGPRLWNSGVLLYVLSRTYLRQSPPQLSLTLLQLQTLGAIGVLQAQHGLLSLPELGIELLQLPPQGHHLTGPLGHFGLTLPQLLLQQGDLSHLLTHLPNEEKVSSLVFTYKSIPCVWLLHIMQTQAESHTPSHMFHCSLCDYTTFISMNQSTH